MTKNAISWHPADILAAVTKRGVTLSRVSIEAGLHASTVKKALSSPCYAGEQAIAAFLDIPAHVIWPGRYDSAGLPKHPRIRKQLNVDNATRKRQKLVAA